MADQNTSFGGRWSDEKLKALREYLQAYTKVLKNTPFKVGYIDAFAGAGTREVMQGQDEGWLDESLASEEAQYRHGSPLIALENDPPFDNFIFIERDASSLQRLKEEVKVNYPSLIEKTNFLHGDANEHLQELARKQWKAHRAVAFLDPFALHVTWATIEKIAQTKAIDMWLLFPAMAVNRMLPKSGEIPEAWAAKLTQSFGDDGWREVFYQKASADLFGDEPITKRTNFFAKLSDYITVRLKTVFAGVHEQPLILKNSAGAPLFLLCFACGNPNAVKIVTGIAQYIINKKNHGN